MLVFWKIAEKGAGGSVLGQPCFYGAEKVEFFVS